MNFCNIKIITRDNWPIQRQLQVNTPINSLDALNDSDAECQIVLVLEDLTNKINVRINNGILIFSVGEPQNLRNYKKEFLDQFDLIISDRKLETSKNLIISRPLLPWFVGMRFNFQSKKWFQGQRYSFEQLSQKLEGNRLNKICVITSNKKISTGHKKRLKIIKKISEKFPGLLDVYGVGYLPIEDKLEVLSNYKYALIIENTIENNYWTEKLADAIISECAIFYLGCPNIRDYLPTETIISLNEFNEYEIFQKIKEAINSEWYQKSSIDIIKCKKILMSKYNIYGEVYKIWEDYSNFNKIRNGNVVINPHSYFESRIYSIYKKIRNLLKCYF